MKGNKIRDIMIIVVVLAVFITGYLIIGKDSETTSTGFKHPEMTGFTMDDSPDIEKIISELPEDYDELIQSGNNYMDHGVYRLAIECYQRARALDSTDANVVIDLGACYHAVGEPENAIEMFEKGLAIEPDHVIGHFNMGIVYQDLGNKEKVVYHWNRVIQLAAGTPLADTAGSYLERLNLKNP